MDQRTGPVLQRYTEKREVSIWIKCRVYVCVSHLVVSDFLQLHGLHAACQVPLSLEFSRQK